MKHASMPAGRVCHGQPAKASGCTPIRPVRTPGEASTNIREAIAIVEAYRTRQRTGLGPMVKASAFSEAIAILQGIKRRR